MYGINLSEECYWQFWLGDLISYIYEYCIHNEMTAANVYGINVIQEYYWQFWLGDLIRSSWLCIWGIDPLSLLSVPHTVLCLGPDVHSL